MGDVPATSPNLALRRAQSRSLLSSNKPSRITYYQGGWRALKVFKKMSSSSNTPPDDYFNDMSRPTGNTGRNKRPRSPPRELNGAADGAANGGDSTIPKPKRIACIICRKRKLKCDGTKPSCSTCTRLGHDCAYDEVRRKSGPKRGYVKALEERLSK